MPKTFFPLFKIGLYTFGCLLAASDTTLAQVTSDQTTDTTVTQNANVAKITGGKTKGDNLFHSFREFSVRTGNEAFFDNANQVANIFSRVTGGNLSQIDGLIRANGSANLFLINPAGIIFGEGASLDIGGSFYGSSASSILFENGEFSAADLENPPLLTINAPIGLSFRDNSGEIVNQSVANDVGLQVSLGETLALIGGDVKLSGGLITAPGGLVELGGLSTTGEISISETGSLSFPDSIIRGDVELTKDAAVDVRADGGGFINVNAKDLLLADTSELLAGIAENMGSPNAQAGDITVNATNSVTVVGDNFEDPNDPEATEALDTSIRNFVGLPVTRRDNSSEDSSAVGNSGSVFVNTNQLRIENRGAISAKVYGAGNSGDVNITAKTVALDAGGIFSQIRDSGRGNSGDINLDVDSLSVKDLSFVITDNKGGGEAGDININATDSVFVGGEIFNALISELGEGVAGKAGDINIDTKSLTIDGTVGGAQLLTTSKGRGDAGDVNINATETISLVGTGSILSQVDVDAEGNGGDINITTKSLDAQRNVTPEVDGNFEILASSKGIGDAGNISINASEKILLDNVLINSELGEGIAGKAGNINIDTKFLTIDGTVGGAQLLTTSKGKGDAGDVNINATETISLLGTGNILSQADVDAEGNGGDINITAKSLDIQGNFTPDNLTNNNFIILASSKGVGDAGNISINATEKTSLSNASILSQVEEQGTGNAGAIVFNSPIISVNDYSLIANGIIGKGNGGNINITSDTFSIVNFSILASNARNNAMGSGGNIKIDSEQVKISEGAVISAFTENDSDGGKITINANNLEMLSGGKIVTQTDGGGDAGNTILDIADGIFIDGSNPARSGELQPFEDNLLIELEPETGLFANASANSTGNSGNISIVTPNSLNLVNGAQISVDSRGAGNSGTLSIQANDLNLDNGFISAATVAGAGGLLSLDVDGNIILRNRSKISAEAFGDADGGNIDINANFIIAFPDGNSDIIANAQQGQGGRIEINTESILGIAERPFLNDLTNDINASSDFGLDGTVSIITPEADALQGETELPTKIVAPEQTTAQACQANRESLTANNFNNLIINGKGGMPTTPDMPLNSEIISIGSQQEQNISVVPQSTSEVVNTNRESNNRESNSINPPQAIATVQGDIVPARGIVKTPDGRILLSSYIPGNQSDRHSRSLTKKSTNCN